MDGWDVEIFNSKASAVSLPRSNGSQLAWIDRDKSGNIVLRGERLKVIPVDVLTALIELDQSLPRES